MRVETVEIDGFACHDRRVFALGGRRGSGSGEGDVTLVVGPNGSGKSSVLEAVLWCLYGKTLRGAKLTTPGRPCRVRAQGDFGSVDRRVSEAGSPALVVEAPADPAAGRGAARRLVREAQVEIDAAHGDFDLFASSRVFSRDFSARFAAATDAGRKGLLEQVLGLGAFDRALVRVREVLAASRRARDGLVAAEQVASSARDVVRSMLGSAGPAQDLGALESAAAARLAEVDALDREAGKMEDLVRRTEALVSGSSREEAVASAEATRAADRLRAAERAAAAGPEAACRACGRAFAPGDVAAEGERLSAAVAEARDMVVLSRAQQEAAASVLEDLRGDGAVLSGRWGDNRTAVRAAGDSLRRAREELARARAREEGRQVLLAELVDRETALGAASAALAAHQPGLSVLGAAEQVLGLRGARAAMMAGALARLGVEANRVLARLGTDQRVAITQRRKTRDGREVEVIGLSVAVPDALLARRVLAEGSAREGATEYDACSSGERARIDVALLLGVASLRGAQTGLLAFDEVFDSLDQDGVERVVGLVRELGVTRQVLVITHREDLVQHFGRGSVLRLPGPE